MKIIGTVTVVFSIAALFILASRDLSFTPGLAIENRVVGPEDNAFTHLSTSEVENGDGLQAGDILLQFSDGGEVDAEAAQALIESNRHNLELFTKAAATSVFQDPATADASFSHEEYTNLEEADLNTIRSLNSIYVLSAYLSAVEGDAEAAREKLRNSVKIGVMIADSQAGLIYYLVGNALAAHGLETYKQLQEKELLSSEPLFEAQEVVRLLGKFESGLEGAFTYEAVSWLAVVDNLILENNYSSYSFKPNKTKKIAHDHYVRLIDEVDTFCTSGLVHNYSYLDKYRQFENRPNFIAVMYENGIGKKLIGTTIAILSEALGRNCDLKTMLQNT